jgi:ankyrin repeat protein
MASSDKILDDRGWTPLHIKARKGNLKQVRRLLDEGAHVNVPALGPKFCGATPLHLASGGGHLKVMNELLERGAASMRGQRVAHVDGLPFTMQRSNRISKRSNF